MHIAFIENTGTKVKLGFTVTGTNSVTVSDGTSTATLATHGTHYKILTTAASRLWALLPQVTVGGVAKDWLIPKSTAVTVSLNTVTGGTTRNDLTALCAAGPNTGITPDSWDGTATAVSGTVTAKKLTLKQNKAASTTYYVGITNPTFQPATIGAMGRFYFKPSFSAPAMLHAGGNSKFAYTFNGLDFGAETTC